MNDELKSKNLEDYLIADKDAKMELLKSSLEDYRDIIHKKLSGNVTADLEEFCKMNSIGCYGLIFTMINTYNRIDSLIKTQNEIKVML